MEKGLEQTAPSCSLILNIDKYLKFCQVQINVYEYMGWYPKFSQLGLPYGQKLTMSQLAAFTLEVFPFHTTHRTQQFCQCFKRVMELVFSEGIYYCLHFCLDHLCYFKPAAFLLALQLGEQRTATGGQVC